MTTFSKDFKILTGHDPMPWQSVLFDEYFARGKLPDGVDIPTGLGKTAVMAIWLIAMARQLRQGRTMQLPRRLVYVVDRRAVVDHATSFAETLRQRLDTEEASELRAALGLNISQRLPISTLRGQFVDNREWLQDPSTPAIIVGTVDMVGSRLLFEGYGVSRKMRPFHAGLLGVDTLVVLDEAHLVMPFEHLLRSVVRDPALQRHPEFNKMIPPFRLLSLSATGRTQQNVFGLTEEDLQHEIVKRRLNAKKSLRIEERKEDTNLENALAEHAWTLADKGAKAVHVVVYSDSREVAEKAKKVVEKHAKEDKITIETELFVGGRRVYEREGAKERLKSLGFIAGSMIERSGPVFLFATSAGEVGIDLDADHMVCDLVAWERMVQRLGRVNRRGDGEANVVVIVPPKPEASTKEQKALGGGDAHVAGEDEKPEASTKEQKALDKRNRNEVERKLVEGHKKKVPDRGNWQKAIECLHVNDDGTFDASPGAIRDLKTRAATDEALQKILHDATTPEPLRPALTRPLVDAWAMTSLEKHTGRPAIQPWLRGWIEDDPPQTAVAWRTHLPVRRAGPAACKKEIEAFFEAAPVHTSEILEMETHLVTKWLAARAERVRKQQAGQHSAGEGFRLGDDDVVAFALDSDGSLRNAFQLGELRNDDERKKLLAGATLVLDARLAGLRDGLLDDAEEGLPRTADDGQGWLAERAVGFRVRSIEAGAVVTRDRNWRERFRFASAVTEEGEATRWLIVEKWRHDAATEEDRSAGHPQLLDEHEEWTEDRARRLAKALGLDHTLTEVLALAARLHDEGKRAAKWQRAFRAPKDGIYAKTEGPIDYRLLNDYRHELGSLLRVENDERIRNLPEEHRDLVLHMIAAHHGFARPVIGTRGCEDAPPSALAEKAAEIALRFVRMQDNWGPWGLAWLEALLRAADQQASRENDARSAPQGGA